MTARLNLNMFQGDTYIHEFILNDGDGNPLDVTGWSARMQVRPSAESDTVIFEASSTEGDIIIGTTDGKISLNIAPAKTSLLLTTKQSYDIETTAVDGSVWSFVYGTVQGIAETTR